MVQLSGLNFVQGDANGLTTDSVVVLEFWATWCPPCRQTIPHLSQIYNKFKDKNVFIVGITNEDNESQIRSFVKKMGAQMNYAVAIDATGAVNNDYMARYHVTGIPHAFILDRKGDIAWHGHPADTAFERALDKAASAPFAPKTATPSDNNKTASEKPLKSHYTHDELASMGVKELKANLGARSIDFSDCVEKGDLVARIESRL